MKTKPIVLFSIRLSEAALNGEIDMGDAVQTIRVGFDVSLNVAQEFFKEHFVSPEWNGWLDSDASNASPIDISFFENGWVKLAVLENENIVSRFMMESFRRGTPFRVEIKELYFPYEYVNTEKA
jgi:hypothetical protein